jgi:hypothetical protein
VRAVRGPVLADVTLDHFPQLVLKQPALGALRKEGISCQQSRMLNECKFSLILQRTDLTQSSISDQLLFKVPKLQAKSRPRRWALAIPIGPSWTRAIRSAQNEKTFVLLRNQQRMHSPGVSM